MKSHFENVMLERDYDGGRAYAQSKLAQVEMRAYDVQARTKLRELSEKLTND